MLAGPRRPGGGGSQVLGRQPLGGQATVVAELRRPTGGGWATTVGWQWPGTG
jgi:hypothetical protein